jgi:hypothetical protein
MFTLSSIHTDFSYLRYRGAMHAMQLRAYKFIRSQLRTSSGKKLCLAASKLKLHHSRLPRATGLCHVDITQITKYYNSSGLRLTNYCIFTQFNFLNLVFFLLPYAKPLSNQNYIIRFLFIDFIEGTSTWTRKPTFKKITFPIQTKVHPEVSQLDYRRFHTNLWI